MVVFPIAVVPGYLVDGAAGAWGAAIGMGIAVGFFVITVGVALGTAAMDTATLGVRRVGLKTTAPPSTMADGLLHQNPRT